MSQYFCYNSQVDIFWRIQEICLNPKEQLIITIITNN